MQGAWTIERTCEEERPSRSGHGDRLPVGGTILAVGLVQYPRIAGRFLVEPESRVGRPGQRVEPLEAKEDEGEVIGEKVAGFVMGQLVIESEAPERPFVPRSKMGGSRNLIPCG